MSQQQARALVLDGEPQSALALLQASVKKKPTDLSLRVFLFELLIVLCDWDRAEKQLQVIRKIGDTDSLFMFLRYQQAVEAERQRELVFAGRKPPTVLGEPEEWIGLLIQAISLLASGQIAAAGRLRDQAFEAAPARTGIVNEVPFTWIADADPRIGPCLEAIVNGEYYWIPFTQVKTMSAPAPETLRDLVWLPVEFEWVGGGNAVGLIPVRYPGSADSENGAASLSRVTLWKDVADNYCYGEGQRLLVTDQEEIALLDVRSLEFDDESDSRGDS